MWFPGSFQSVWKCQAAPPITRAVITGPSACSTVNVLPTNAWPSPVCPGTMPVKTNLSPSLSLGMPVENGSLPSGKP